MKLIPWEPDLRTIVDRINGEDIDLQPDFQRQEIWPALKKKRLIDTILRGWSIPPVFLVVAKDGHMDVLDGQQRLAAIRDFFANSFSIDGAATPQDDFIESLGGKFYRDLDQTQRRLVDNHTLRCFKITDYNPDEPSELFYRLNQPTMLTAGEQRNAFYGPAREQLKELVALFESLGNSKTTLGFSNSRLAYDDIIARILYFIEQGSFAKKSTEKVISQRFKSREEFSHDVFGATERAIRIFSDAREFAGRVRFNKASSLSWLLFYCRWRGASHDHRFLDWFYHVQEEGVGHDPRVMLAVELFKDRSSLRVTDVSSVVFRDIALWYAYYVGSPNGEIHADIPMYVLETLDSYLSDGQWDEEKPDIAGFLQHQIRPAEWATIR
ncbi:DUF262 domain-containing protein [Erythrobacter litoralis]|uniref:DUF262 domain-containing protein n=1 Tax=Erythrobacter litoralis TaxID=39960 RepID=UPI002434CA98|nr:DUF262 domain-containing protein [Erythrobacter litoralis]MDG6079729.1 DUF262 domain-containing protein [Erythrobacter litoralis]